MPVIIAPADYHRWLSPFEPDLNDLMKPHPSDPMAIWPISTRVNSPGNYTPDIRDLVDP
jgi:putative SOS response-associated peptidase YedK